MLSNPNYFCTNIQSSDQKCYLGNICVIIHHISILFGKHSYLLLSIIDIVPKAKVLTILFTKAIFSDL